MINKLVISHFFLLFGFTLTGCSTDVVEKIYTTAWSDNSEKIAFVERRHEEVHGVDESAIKNIEYRVGIINRDGESKQFITNYFKGSKFDYPTSRNDLYYKSNAGYVLVGVGNSGRVVVDHEVFTDDYDYYVFDLNGNIIYKISKDPQQYCESFTTVFPPIRATPSPSGNLIAKVEATSDCGLEVSFLDYSKNFQVVNKNRITGVAITGLFWVNENNLLINACIWGGCTDNWVLVRPGREKTVSIDNDLFISLCLAGAIVSSNINQSGEKIKWSDPGSTLEVIKTQDYSGTELNWMENTDTRLPDNPENCISIENI